MMGVGKSTIGRELAKRLKCRFIDIDKIIETKEKRTIKSIFETKGEEYFRKLEKKINIEEINKKNLVIALGGGAFLDTSVRKLVKNTCISFWLDLSINLLLPRLKNNLKRPLVNQSNLEQSINKIYSSRKKIYSESNFKIKCDNLEKEKIIKKIIYLYEITRNKV